jgi:hypothetical protein
MTRVHLGHGIKANKQKKCTTSYKNVLTSACEPDYSAIYAGLGLLYVVTQAITQQNQFHIMNCKINTKGSKLDVSRLLATFSDSDPPII